MEDTIQRMLSLKNWAVAGSTHNIDKYAYKIYKKLKSMEYSVYSLNPTGLNTDGDESYKTLSSIPIKPEVISMVINPVKGREIIVDAALLGIKYIWFQPGADTLELVNMAEAAGINVVYNRCVLVELG